MIDIKKYYLYCMGEGYLDRRKYSEDSAHERYLGRVQQDSTDQLYRSLLREQPNLLKQNGQPLFTQPTVFQQAILTLLKPVQISINFLRNLFQLQLPFQQPQLGQVPLKGALFERVMSQILTFFFGFKKDKTEEKEKRFQDDFKNSDFFGTSTVDASQEGQMGGGQK